MADYETIYRERAADYHRLVTAEDCDGSLGPALESVVALEGRDVVEVGAGTGRLTRLLVERGARVRAFERSPAMIDVAREHLAGLPRWELAEAEASRTPVEDACADLAIAGWVFGHFRAWFPSTWRAEVGACVAELERTLRPRGALVIIETLGTGSTSPSPPTEALAEYYAWLEERGFERRALRTDYLFESVDEAARVTGSFFGEAFAARVRQERWARVPECTGVWSRRKAA